ncbi:UDP-N-acetylglucosamine 1-carboxyvinyltransferase [Candidatus Uhrbacteria bacterium]|nr:UDP-N-acetylglucosamine 1-carboxyvinyltransferase [Candidatus Uhrbacteria bacterium]
MQFIIEGGKKLNGDIWVSGAKNAALPIIAATLLTDDECILDNVPRISDVETLLNILKSLGSAVAWTGEHQVTICNRNATFHNPDYQSVKSLRASILFFGSFLARFHTIDMIEPGGCIIGNRPLDTHFHALSKLGVRMEKKNGTYALSSDGLRGAEVVLLEASVTATENILMAAVYAQGVTVIKNAACEPHVQDLVTFLQKLGADIAGNGTTTLTVHGVSVLHGTVHTIIPDTIEAGTFLMLGIANKGKLRINNVIPEHMDVVLEKLKMMGAKFDVSDTTITTHSHGIMRAAKIDARPYPGIPTDLQSVFGVLATQIQGTTLIWDTLFEGRMGYVQELVRMGANAVICDPHRVLITGPTPLYGQEIRSFDLRAGAAMIIAGLIASGRTVINGAEIVSRGYERIVERLQAVGADIQQKDS